MANNDKDKFGYLKEVLDYYDNAEKKLFRKRQKDIQAIALQNIKEQNDYERRNKLNLYDKIEELRAKKQLQSEEEVAKYAKKLVEEQYKDKLESELSILKEISKKETEERERKLEILTYEKNIIKYKNDGNIKEAKQLNKELSKLKSKDERISRKEELKEQGADYNLAANLDKALLGPLRDELALGNAAQRSAEKALTNSLKSVGKAITDGLNVINQTISEYAKYQTAINARLQGTSTFGELVTSLNEVAFSPLISASTLYSNLNDLVNQGIVTNVDQRAFFATIKDGIATTFDASNESLNRIIRIQHTDSTAARLGMEGYLTRFLNVYVENTEYLQSTFDNVASSLLEASAVIGDLRGVGASLEFEYVVQKWLGTLTGIGLSGETAQNIASALGKLGAGDVDILSSDIGRLLTISASTIGENIGELLNAGLSATTTNKLLASMVKYLQTLADSSSNVTKAELAKVFGVSISDLVAVAKMDQAAIKTITDDMLSYTGMYTELRNQFNQLPSRMGIANILENLFSNLTYQTGMSIASNPVSYAMWKITDLIQGVTGGINIPFITALGTGVDLNATVENLMKIGLVGFNMLDNIGGIINGLASIGEGEILLDKLKVNMGSSDFKTFGEGLNLGPFRKRGKRSSQTVYIGQEDADAYYDSTINQERAKSQTELNEKLIENEEAEDPIVKYFSTELKLETKLEALTIAATSRYDMLSQIKADSVNIASALYQINSSLIKNILPAINNSGTGAYGDKKSNNSVDARVDNSENTLVTTNLNSVSTVSTPSLVTEYLNKIDFAAGFELIVQNISAINQKLPANLGAGNAMIEGLTQINRNA